MNLREAAQLALDALEQSRVFVTTREKTKHPEGTEWYDERITALRAALSDATTCQESRQVEPVAWISYESLGRLKNGGNSRGAVPVHTIQSHTAKIPLYTAPPQRTPLTDEEIAAIVRVAAQNSAIKRDGSTSQRIARAIEAAHGIKEEK